MAREWRRGAYLMTTDKARLDLEMIHSFLMDSYWAAGIPAQVVRRAVDYSFALGVFRGDEQVGFARVVTDYATFAYLADVSQVPFRLLSSGSRPTRPVSRRRTPPASARSSRRRRPWRLTGRRGLLRNPPRGLPVRPLALRSSADRARSSLPSLHSPLRVFRRG